MVKLYYFYQLLVTGGDRQCTNNFNGVSVDEFYIYCSEVYELFTVGGSVACFACSVVVGWAGGPLILHTQFSGSLVDEGFL